MSMVENTPPTIDIGTMKKTLRMFSCSKFFAHSPMMMPSRPKISDTAVTQNRNSRMLPTEVTPKQAPITRMPRAVAIERMMTQASMPTIIST